jgi:ERCC4-related helicase
METTVRLRSYQREMLERSLQGNVIVAMDTGSGKTHVAIARIQAELERSDPRKLVWFATPSVALSMQQSDVLKANLRAFSVKTLTGQSGVDAWTDQATWDAVLYNVRIVVGTPKVLEDALTHGFVKISRIALLVFDEAHRCVGNSPMCTIMRHFYYPSKSRGESIPNILGLTASPIMSKASSLDQIESNLDSIAVTPKLHRATLGEHVHIPSLTTIIYTSATEMLTVDHMPRVYEALESAVSPYDLAADPYILQLQSTGDDRSLARLQKQFAKPDTYCLKQLKGLASRSKAISEQLGHSAAEWYVEQCIQKFMQASGAESLISPDFTDKERTHLANQLRKVQESSQSPGVDQHFSDKFQKLIHLLLRQECVSLRAIIFVEQRALVSSLAHHLRHNPDIGKQLSIGTFVGSASFAKSSLVDLVDFKEQQNDLEQFRAGKKNIMIATSVLEEGLDVTACNLVVCFDPPANLISFVQRRGRARQKYSEYAIFLSSRDIKNDPSKWQRLEAEMKQAYQEEREEPQIESQEELNSKSYRTFYRRL